MKHLENFVFDTKTKGDIKKCVVVSHPAFALRHYSAAKFYGAKYHAPQCTCIMRFKKDELVGASYFIKDNNLKQVNT